MKSKEKMWQDVADAIGGEQGKRVVEALRELYSLYTPKMVDWFAGLYDVRLGGFYACNSGRDNDSVIDNDGRVRLLRPDLESTSQSLGFLNNSGMMEGIEGKYPNALPEWMNEQIKSFIYNCQDEDGFFYLPHVGKELTEIYRRGRDLSWATNMLRTYGVTPKYPTILDKKPEKSEEKDSKMLIPEHLSSPEKFAKYLDGLNITGRSYHTGSELSTQAAQIRALGLHPQLVAHLKKLQNPKNGFWHDEVNFYGVSGYMKICGQFIGTGEVPYAYEAACSAFEVILSDEIPATVPIIWNTWVSLERIVNMLRSECGEEGEKTIKRIREVIIARAPEAIRKTCENLERFKADDGGFRSGLNRSLATAGGVPVGLPNEPESFVDPTFIGSVLLTISIFTVLGILEYKVPIFGAEDRKRFLRIIEENHEAAQK